MTKAEIIVKLIYFGFVVSVVAAMHYWDKRNDARDEEDARVLDEEHEKADALVTARLEKLPSEELERMHYAGEITEAYRQAHRSVSNNNTQ